MRNVKKHSSFSNGTKRAERSTNAYRCVGVEQNPSSSALLRDFFYGLQGSRLVVGEHECYQDRVGGDGVNDVPCRNPPLRVDRNTGDADPDAIPLVAGVVLVVVF